MQVLAAWVGFPLAFAALVCGWGLLVEAAAGRRLPGPLVPGVGFAALIVALDLPGFIDALAGLAFPLGVAGAALGIGLAAFGRGPRPGLPRPAWWALGAAGGAFLAYAAPTLFSGTTVVGGYIRLDDSATLTALGDWVLRHGYDISGLPPSTHNSTLAANLPGHYPVGALLPLAAAGRLAATDLAWCYAPYLACTAAVLSLGLYDLARRMVASQAACAGIAIVASASGLLYAYAGWGGVKEIVAAALVATLGALAPTVVAIEVRRGALLAALRGLIPLGAVCAAAFASLSVGGAPWIAFVLAPAFVVAVRRVGAAVAAAAAAAVIALTAALSLVAIGGAGFIRDLTVSPTDPAERLGNLLAPLKVVQVLGIWPAADFRLHPAATGSTTVLLLVLGACIVIGVVAAIRAGAWPVLGYGAGAVCAAVAIQLFSDWPWVEAKALAIAAPAPVFLALVGVASLGRQVGRAVPVMLALLVVGGVVWTDVLTYHNGTITPHARHRELADIAERFSSAKPSLMTEYDPWGARWFLRGMDVEGASELRYRVVPLLDGSQTPKTTTADIDRYQLGGLLVYRALVLRRSPLASRPPSPFRLAWTGRYYEVWLRQSGAPAVLEHLPLGGESSSGSVATCSETRRLAQLASPGGRLVAAPARSAQIAGLDRAARPAPWAASPNAAGAVLPVGAGTATTAVQVPRAGRYSVWLGGAVKARTTVAVDGTTVAVLRSDLQYDGQWLPAGSIALGAGAHTVTVHSDGGGLAPASGSAGAGEPFAIGPVALSPSGAPGALVSVPPSGSRRLCRLPLDWIEAVRP